MKIPSYNVFMIMLFIYFEKNHILQIDNINMIIVIFTTIFTIDFI